jgi:polyisoprenyl-teichoic acid--peptidoglycan teichoic acid transferase
MKKTQKFRWEGVLVSKKKKMILSLVSALLIIVLGYGTYLAYSVYHFSSTISNSDSDKEKVTELKQPENNDETINILLVGIDGGQFKNNTYRQDVGRTDTIMIFSLNKKTNKISLLSVPRDTRLNIPGKGMDKVNAAHAYGGINLSIKTLSEYLGIPIHHYVKVNYNAFTKVVDGLGGVTINVTEDVRYFVDGQIKVPKGIQKMDGQTAFNYVQVREGDIKRVERQQKFVKALAEQAISVSTLPKVPGILNNIAGDIKTDISPKDMLDLINNARSMNPGGIKNEILPGTAGNLKGVSYWMADDNAKKDVVNRLFY